jgi:hypothetical protein
MPLFPKPHLHTMAEAASNQTAYSSWLLNPFKGRIESSPTLAMGKFNLKDRWSQVKSTCRELHCTYLIPLAMTTTTTPVVERAGVSAGLTLRLKAFKAVFKDHATCTMTQEGCGGAYLVDQEGIPVAIFKPRDEEFMAPANPRGYRCSSTVVGQTPHPERKGFCVGSGAVREVAAYMIDAAYDHFSGVPTTSFLTAPLNGIWKEGSVQAFVSSECSAEDMGSGQFNAADVHKIGILDIRLFNTDRHAGNILICTTSQHDDANKYHMVPIDHGLTLPSYRHLDEAKFDWLSWPQAKYPFSPESMAHICRLDITKDAILLRSLGIPEECITTMLLTTVLLQKAASVGFSLYDIGSMLQRDHMGHEPSVLENMVTAARCNLAVEEATYNEQVFGMLLLKHVSEAIDTMLRS